MASVETLADVLSLPFVPVCHTKLLPRIPAVYFALDAQRGEVLYVGSSKSLGQRWAGAAHVHRDRTSFLAWFVAGDVKECRRVERECIKRFKPTLNHLPLEVEVVAGVAMGAEVAAIIRGFAETDERPLAFVIRKLIEDSPRVKAALKANAKK